MKARVIVTLLLVAGVMLLVPGRGAPVAAASSCLHGLQVQQVTTDGSNPVAGSVPVLFVHGINDNPAMTWDPSSPASIPGEASAIAGATAWTFSYAAQSLQWVTNPSIGRDLAIAISCLASLSGHNVIVVAHSMGGLATQLAVSVKGASGKTVADHVAEVITIGTPYQGSQLLTWVQALIAKGPALVSPQAAALIEAVRSACAGIASTGSSLCPWVSSELYSRLCQPAPSNLACVPPSPVGTALETGTSGKIGTLPPWPTEPKIPVWDVAGDVTLSLFGNFGRLDLHGDVAVTVQSATAHNTAPYPPEVLSCTTDIPHLVTLTPSLILSRLGSLPCYHLNLPTNPTIVARIIAELHWEVFSAAGWSRPAKVAPGPITSVSCSGQFCAAVGATGAYTHPQGFALTYSNGTWSKPAALGVGNRYTVSCPTQTLCVAVTDTGYAYTLRDPRNDTWSGPTDIYPSANGLHSQFSATDAVRDISCASSRFCTAVTAEGKALTRNGTRWSAPVAIGLPAIQAAPAFIYSVDSAGVSCPAATFCLTAASLRTPGAVAAWDGSGWSPAPPPPASLGNDFSSVNCTSRTFCMVTGGVHADGDISSVWNGTSWSTLARPAREGAALGFGQVSCPIDGFCLAIDGGAGVNGEPANATTSRGTGIFAWAHGTWSGPEVVDSSGSLDALSCSHSGFCIAADTAGYVYHDEASTAAAPSPTAPSSTITCPTSAQLLAAWSAEPTAVRQSWAAAGITISGFEGIGCWNTWVVAAPIANTGNGIFVFSQKGQLHLQPVTQLQEFRTAVCASPGSPDSWRNETLANCQP